MLVQQKMCTLMPPLLICTPLSAIPCLCVEVVIKYHCSASHKSVCLYHAQCTLSTAISFLCEQVVINLTAAATGCTRACLNAWGLSSLRSHESVNDTDRLSCNQHQSHCRWHESVSVSSCTPSSAIPYSIIKRISDVHTTLSREC